MEVPRKAPAVERRVVDISEEDARVRIIGEIVKTEESMAIKDETAEIKINSEKTLENGQLVRVFGKPVKTKDGLEISSEFVQNMSDLNRNLYKTIHALNKGDNNE